MKTKKASSVIPPTKDTVDGLDALRRYFWQDMPAGFVVFLLALPLSLGIATASGVPPVMGIISAVLGGVVATFFTGSKLTIKGPAAGLIVIIAGAVGDFGGGISGWQLAAGAMLVAGLLQILFGMLRLGRYVDVFPLAAVHGMLAAIGLIIIAKQLPVLLNVDPKLTAGASTIDIAGSIPLLVREMDVPVTLIGIVSLFIMSIWSRIPFASLKVIPAPLIVLVLAVPVGLWLELDQGPRYTLVQVGSIIDSISINVDMGGSTQLGLFIKYVLMLALVGSIESLLTVKAVDQMTTQEEEPDPDKDLIAIGISNTLAALLGAIPMISEVARSSANVQNGAKSRWANFYHGLFLVLFAVLAYPLLEMIPNTALAAMLIYVGFHLAHPREFLHMLQIGKEQLVIFLTTVIVTLVSDLLLGISAGIFVKVGLHLLHGVRLRSLLNCHVTCSESVDLIEITLHDSAIFSNYIGIRQHLPNPVSGKHVVLHLASTVMVVDHSVMQSLDIYRSKIEQHNGSLRIMGINQLIASTAHPQAARIRPRVSISK